MAWDTKTAAIGGTVALESHGGSKTDPGRGVATGAALDGVTEAPISQGKVLHTQPILYTGVDLVQKKVFLGPVPTLVVTTGSGASPGLRSLTGKCCQGPSSMDNGLAAAFQATVLVPWLERQPWA